MAIAKSGKGFLVALCGYTEMGTPSLNESHYRSYIKTSLKKATNMASLPPIEAAAQSLTVYYQVQQWFGNKKSPEDGLVEKKRMTFKESG